MTAKWDLTSQTTYICGHDMQMHRWHRKALKHIETMIRLFWPFSNYKTVAFCFFSLCLARWAQLRLRLEGNEHFKAWPDRLWFWFLYVPTFTMNDISMQEWSKKNKIVRTITSIFVIPFSYQKPLNNHIKPYQNPTKPYTNHIKSYQNPTKTT